MFQINFSNCSGVFGVPNEVVDKHLKLSGALALKVLLVLFRHGKPMEPLELAEILSQAEGDVRDALNQWVQLGVIENTNEPVQPVLESKPVESPVVEPVKPISAIEVKEEKPKETKAKEPVKADKKVVRMEKFRRMTRQDVNECAASDENVAILLQEAQNILSRPLSNGESEMLVSFYHYYGMKLDILLMLLHYCKSVGKSKPGQYERIALEWLNRGIDSHEKAEKELLELSKQESLETEIRKLLNIPDDIVVDIKARHVEYYKNWKSSDEQLLKLACERTINAIDAFSIDYMNTILVEWQKKGITTFEQASKESGPAKKNTKKAVPQGSASYDLGKLEEMLTHGSVWD